jgi:hypothetical protein
LPRIGGIDPAGCDRAHLYFHENDPWQALNDIIRKRGPTRETYTAEASTRHPRTKALFAAIEEYSTLVDRFAASWRFWPLTLTARPPHNDRQRTNVLIEWIGKSG